MKKQVTLKELRVIVRRLVENELDDELNRVEVGDVVDVRLDEMGTVPVRVLELVDDVNKAAGPPDRATPRNSRVLASSVRLTRSPANRARWSPR